jgi:hypothetical protein
MISLGPLGRPGLSSVSSVTIPVLPDVAGGPSTETENLALPGGDELVSISKLTLYWGNGSCPA